MAQRQSASLLETYLGSHCLRCMSAKQVPSHHWPDQDSMSRLYGSHPQAVLGNPLQPCKTGGFSRTEMQPHMSKSSPLRWGATDNTGIVLEFPSGGSLTPAPSRHCLHTSGPQVGITSMQPSWSRKNMIFARTLISSLYGPCSIYFRMVR